MNIEQIKMQIGVSALDLVSVVDTETGESTSWYISFTSKGNRVTIHKDTLNQIKENPEVRLGLQEEAKINSEGVAYTHYRIVRYKNEPDFTI